MTRLIVIFIIWAIISLISLTFLAVLLRRLYMKRRYRLLDAEREKFRFFYDSLISGAPLNLKELKDAGPIGRLALEEFLFKALEANGERNDILGYFDELGFTEDYIKRLKGGNYWEQAFASDRLGRIRCGRAVPELIDALGRKNRDVKNMAVHSLGAIRDKRAVPHLINLLKESVQKDEEVSLRIIKSSLISLGQEAVAELIAELKCPVWQVRSATADILGEIGSREAEAPFIEALSDPEQDIRAKAAKGLGKIKSRAAIPHLYNAALDRFWVVRLHAVRALGLIGEPQAIDAVRARLVDKNWQVRRVAAEALGGLGDGAFPVLLEVFLYDEDRYAKEQASFAFEKAGVINGLMDFLLTPEISKNPQYFADIKGDPPQSKGFGSTGVFREMALKLKEAGENRCREALKYFAAKDFSAKEVEEAVESVKRLEA